MSAIDRIRKDLLEAELNKDLEKAEKLRRELAYLLDFKATWKRPHIEDEGGAATSPIRHSSSDCADNE